MGTETNTYKFLTFFKSNFTVIFNKIALYYLGYVFINSWMMLPFPMFWFASLLITFSIQSYYIKTSEDEHSFKIKSTACLIIGFIVAVQTIILGLL